MTASEPMSDERLVRLSADNEPVGDHLSGLTVDEVAELLDEVKRWRGLADRSVDDLSADDEWDENRQLREMLAAATMRAKTAEAQLAKIMQYTPERIGEAQAGLPAQHAALARAVYWEGLHAAAAATAKRAERELAEVRERIGREQLQWGVRYTAGVDGAGANCSEEEDPVDYCDDQADATRLAAQTPGAIPVWHLRGEWKEPTS